MHNLDVGSDVLVEVNPGLEVCDPLAWREGGSPTVVDTHEIRCGRRQLASVEHRVASSDHGPRVCVGGRFAGEVSGLEFGDGGFEVVEVERYERRDLLVAVDLDDAEHVREKCPGSLIAAPSSGTVEDEVLAADRDGV